MEARKQDEEVYNKVKSNIRFFCFIGGACLVMAFLIAEKAPGYITSIFLILSTLFLIAWILILGYTSRYEKFLEQHNHYQERIENITSILSDPEGSFESNGIQFSNRGADSRSLNEQRSRFLEEMEELTPPNLPLYIEQLSCISF